jgi:pimeloyl-ACP methyl ester carboxylesterase
MREYGEFLTSLKPAAEFTVIPDAGHWVSYEAADRFNQILGALGA